MEKAENKLLTLIVSQGKVTVTSRFFSCIICLRLDESVNGSPVTSIRPFWRRLFNLGEFKSVYIFCVSRAEANFQRQRWRLQVGTQAHDKRSITMQQP